MDRIFVNFSNFLYNLTKANIRKDAKKVAFDELFFFIHKEDPEFEIGQFSYGDIHVYSYQKGTRIRIGNYCSISEITMIIGGDHHRGITTYPFRTRILSAEVSGDNIRSMGITIGHDVWIGFGATILDGVKIGTGSIIGANALVTRDTPAYSISVGSPAKVVGTRFDKGEIDKLLGSRWWELPPDFLEKYVDLLYRDDVDSFVNEIIRNTTDKAEGQ